MATVTKCRRCTDCQLTKHHWLNNPGFADDEAESSDIEFICKHCPATGSECRKCHGSGQFKEPRSAFSDICPVCDGEGVLTHDHN
jgi:DnaJ-class molecular chaperone